MLKKYNKSILATVLCSIISLVYAENVKTNELANITPATITPATVTPATITPATITPPTITPTTIVPQTITPSNTTPSTTTPAITTPVTITPATVNPGNSSSATSTSIQLPNTTASDVDASPRILRSPAGMVIKVLGTAEALKENKKVHHLKDGSLFFVHDIIYTKPDSDVAIRFNDGSFLVLGPDSALEIKKYHFTIPSHGQSYQGASRDRAVIKLYKGNFKAKLGSLVTANKPSVFEILTPRGRLELTNPQANAEVNLIYNNKIGLAVKAVGILNNSKGQVTLTAKLYGLVSAVIGSSPLTTNMTPLAFADEAIKNTGTFFAAQISQINTVYNESMMAQEKQAMASDAADSAADVKANGDVAGIGSNEGDDDGSTEDNDMDDDTEDTNNNDDDDDNNDDN